MQNRADQSGGTFFEHIQGWDPVLNFIVFNQTLNFIIGHAFVI